MLISTYPSTVTHSLEEEKWARLEHMSENVFKFPDICSEHGSTGPSSLTSTGTGVNSTSGVVSHSDIDRDASFDAFSTFGGTQKVDKGEEEQKKDDLMTEVMGYLPAPQCMDDYENEEITGKTGKDVKPPVDQQAIPSPFTTAATPTPVAEIEEQPTPPATSTTVPSTELYCSFNEAILHAIESLSKATQPAATATPSSVEFSTGVAHTAYNGQTEDVEMVDNAADRKKEEESSSDEDSVACCRSVEGTDPPGETNREYSGISIANEEHAHSKTYQVQTRPESREVPETGPSSELLTDRNNEGKEKEGVAGTKVRGGKKKAENSNGSGKKCEWCGKEFARDMARHIRTHTGEKTHACSKCCATFARSDVCKTHEASCGMDIPRGRPPLRRRDDLGDDDQGRVAQRRRL